MTEKEESPLHIKVKQMILKKIKSGVYKSDTKLPTEAEFCHTFKVSRTTVRTALQQLAVEGYVYKQQGSGTFVSGKKVKQKLTSTVESFSEQITLQGKNPSIKVLSLEVIPVDHFLGEVFALKTGDPVNKLERIRSVNGEPLQYEVAFLPWKKTPGLNIKACEKSLYNVLQKEHGHFIKKTIEYLEIVTVTKEVQKILEIPLGSPCFSLETYAYLEDETVIEYSKTIFRGDMANFVIERNY
ncbi:GntR family transcriptional regulator [Sutcliffiella horikoshii]|uniref:GntR family transcriptional regulator n=1 Tax=Sutcliffiella horikoshii TaxID=79883 RepID=A0A1Y0CK55_9BACI|nr:GntR family transcriptional regulator [Sutcliffiella horikoshii]ART75305.1 GntR family transcriptional regulator [Sutcliffiella horikoshii]TYS58680.1 GntR family transcriptional regulator [Sutcliffiella horikoshii]